MKRRVKKYLLPEDQWKSAVRSSWHPVLGLLVVNVGIAIYSFPADHILIAALFGVVLPGGVLVCLAQTLSSRVAHLNLGVFPRAGRPVGYWLTVAGLFCVYFFTSAAPIVSRYFPSSPEL